MLIQVALAVTRQAIHRASVRAIAGVTLLGAICSAWPGIFAWDLRSSELWQRLSAAPSLGAVLVAALIPVLDAVDRRSSSAGSVSRLSGGPDWTLPVGAWLAGQFVALVLFVLSAATAMAASGEIRKETLELAFFRGVCVLWPAVAVTGAFARALASICAPPLALGATAAAWVASAAQCGVTSSGAISGLPGLDTLSIILPPMAVLTASIQSTWGVDGGAPPLQSQGLLSGVATAACLVATVGIERLRRI